MAAHTIPPSFDGPNGAPIDWSAALAEHDRWLRTAVRSRLGEPQAVDEVMQEVALAALAQQAPLRHPDKLGGWLYRLAIRQALLYRRRHGRRRKLLDGYAAAPNGAPAPDPLGWLLLDERRALVRSALERLPRRDAEILLLKYIENWSYRTLAAHLGIAESAVEARLHRARQRLRDAMILARVIEVNE